MIPRNKFSGRENAGYIVNKLEIIWQGARVALPEDEFLNRMPLNHLLKGLKCIGVETTVGHVQKIEARTCILGVGFIWVGGWAEIVTWREVVSNQGS